MSSVTFISETWIFPSLCQPLHHQFLSTCRPHKQCLSNLEEFLSAGMMQWLLSGLFQCKIHTSKNKLHGVIYPLRTDLIKEVYIQYINWTFDINIYKVIWTTAGNSLGLHVKILQIWCCCLWFFLSQYQMHVNSHIWCQQNSDKPLFHRWN